MSKKVTREIDRHNDEMSILSSADRINRARSVTVGTAFGGLTEILMRGDGKHLWAILQPSEVIELVHQLAANVGCHIHIQPRNDFASWRKWKDVEPDKPPVQNIPISEQQSKLQPALMARSNENEQTLATQKTVGRKRTKRAAAAA